MIEPACVPLRFFLVFINKSLKSHVFMFGGIFPNMKTSLAFACLFLNEI